jgi:hypothetical protein
MDQVKAPGSGHWPQADQGQEYSFGDRSQHGLAITDLGLRFPRIDNFNVQIGEMSDVSGCELRPTSQQDSGYLRIAHVNRVTIPLPLSSQHGCGLGGWLVKIKDATLQVFNHQFVKGRFKRPSAPSFR